ncbi:hypothetical protein [Aquimarina sp. AU119]|uniref:hypothetical protein n=1 Tax=Aquimarina sp. AU119 TaxID=2108528 RepID=UPI0013577A1B|nr:hypothetical protein [Aquimarina sp. AU119]
MSVFYMQGQEVRSTEKTSKKFQFNFYLSPAAFGNQGVALPLMMTKLLPSVEYSITKKTSTYASSGITIGIAPFTVLHFETGIAFKGFTVDYSTNAFISLVKEEDDEDDKAKRTASNGNINLGFRFRLGKNKGTLLWLKIGKSISGKGFDGVHPIWNGNHAEIRILMD